MSIKKRKKSEGSADRYIIPYADLITLLLAFFIVLYSMSDPNEQKMETLSQSLAVAFNSSSSSIDLNDNKKTEAIRTYRQSVTDEELSTMKSISEKNNLRRLKTKIDRQIKENGLSEKVNSELSDIGLKIILTDEILFDSASSELKNNQSKKLINDISKLISDVKNPISIEGHTDNIPINNSEFDSNWELSSARALSVLKQIIKTSGLPPTQFSSTGYGEFQPIYNNDTEIGKSKNRRVEIIIRKLNEGDLLEYGGETK